MGRMVLAVLAFWAPCYGTGVARAVEPAGSPKAVLRAFQAKLAKARSISGTIRRVALTDPIVYEVRTFMASVPRMWREKNSFGDQPPSEFCTNGATAWDYSAARNYCLVSKAVPFTPCDDELLGPFWARWDPGLLRAAWPLRLRVERPLSLGWSTLRHKPVVEVRYAWIEFYLDPRSDLPVAAQANGTVEWFENLKLGPAIAQSTFTFHPPKGVKLIAWTGRGPGHVKSTSTR